MWVILRNQNSSQLNCHSAAVSQHNTTSLLLFSPGRKRLPLQSAEGTRVYYFSSPGKITEGDWGEGASLVLISDVSAALDVGEL